VQLAQELWSCKVIAFQVAHAGLEGKISPAPKVLIPFLFLLVCIETYFSQYSILGNYAFLLVILCYVPESL